MKRLDAFNLLLERALYFQEQANPGTCGTLRLTCTLACTWSLSRRLDGYFGCKHSVNVARRFETHKQNRGTFFFCLRPAVAIGCHGVELFQALINSRAANKASAKPTPEWWPLATGLHLGCGRTTPLNDGLTMHEV